jgi:DNA-binding response OmpR family regulator
MGALRILLVDDHEDTADLTERLLRQFGHRISKAYDFASASALASDREFELLISDLSLPDGSGLALMTMLRPRGVKGIALTGHGAESDIRASLAAGFACHLTKPITLEQLVRAIERVTE